MANVCWVTVSVEYPATLRQAMPRVHEKLGLPIRFVGVGEKIDDLIFFSATDFAEALLPEVPQHKKEETEQAGEEQA